MENTTSPTNSSVKEKRPVLFIKAKYVENGEKITQYFRVTPNDVLKVLTIIANYKKYKNVDVSVHDHSELNKESKTKIIVGGRSKQRVFEMQSISAIPRLKAIGLLCDLDSELYDVFFIPMTIEQQFIVNNINKKSSRATMALLSRIKSYVSLNTNYKK